MRRLQAKRPPASHTLTFAAAPPLSSQACSKSWPAAAMHLRRPPGPVIRTAPRDEPSRPQPRRLCFAERVGSKQPAGPESPAFYLPARARNTSRKLSGGWAPEISSLAPSVRITKCGTPRTRSFRPTSSSSFVSRAR